MKQAVICFNESIVEYGDSVPDDGEEGEEGTNRLPDD